jgi:hypothetical protein
MFISNLYILKTQNRTGGMASGAFYISAIACIRLPMYAIQISRQSQSSMTFAPVDGKLDIRRD